MNTLAMAVLVSMAADVLSAALSRLNRAYPEFATSGLEQVIAADVDGDGRKDWVGLARSERRWAILVAYARRDGWRAGNIDMGEGPGPERLQVLPAGAYGRDATCSSALGPNERTSFRSSLAGVMAFGFQGMRRAYQLGQHAWGYVCVGRETP